MTGRASKLVGLAWVLAACGLVALTFASIPLLAKATPWSWETALQSVLAPEDPSRACASSPAIEAARAKLLRRLYPRLAGDDAVAVRVVYTRDPEVNAVASLGGVVTVYAGLLRRAPGPDLLAGVLAHEIAHVTRRHVMQAVVSHVFTAAVLQTLITGDAARFTQEVLGRTYGTAQENEADAISLRRLAAARVDVNDLARFYEADAAETDAPFLSDHPASADRARRVRRAGIVAGTPTLDAAEWRTLREACGGKPSEPARDQRVP